jgi:apolipoprotein N-acyltransferase
LGRGTDVTDLSPQVVAPPQQDEPPATTRSRPSAVTVAGFVLAVTGTVLFWVSMTFAPGGDVHFVGTYDALIALLLGLGGSAACVFAYRKAKRRHESKGLALAGTIIGAVPAVVVVGGFLLFLVVTLLFGA